MPFLRLLLRPVIVRCLWSSGATCSISFPCSLDIHRDRQNVDPETASLRLLPKGSSKKIRVLFIWHLFDALIHFFFEGSFLFNCFFISYSLPTSFSVAARQHPHIRLLTPPDVYWLGSQDKLYGANYGTGPFSRLWQEYAKADHRWGGVDLGVVSLEVLTVFIGTPLARKFDDIPMCGLSRSFGRCM